MIQSHFKYIRAELLKRLNEANINKKLIDFEFDGIPALPKGEAEIRFTFSIDIERCALIEQLCLTNGERLIKRVTELNLVV